MKQGQGRSHRRHVPNVFVLSGGYGTRCRVDEGSILEREIGIEIFMFRLFVSLLTTSFIFSLDRAGAATPTSLDWWTSRIAFRTWAELGQ